MSQGSGVSISIGASANKAVREISNLSGSLAKLAAGQKTVFANQQGVTGYTRNLILLERSLDRVTQRVKTLQTAQAALLQQQKQLQAPGANAMQAGQLQITQKALQQNQRNLLFWQSKQMAVQAQVTAAASQQPRAAIGGGGGGTANTLMAGGGMGALGGAIGGTLGTAVGGPAGTAIGVAVGSVVGKLIDKVTPLITLGFRTAIEEQKGFADLAPRMRFGAGGTAMTSSQGWMDRLRVRGMPLGFNGVESLGIASAMSTGSSAKGLLNDTQAAMQMGRMFGIDAGGQASMLAEGGKMGGFAPGQAKRFAEMLARQIKVEGLGPRAQEVQEATLMLMHRQMATSATSSPATAMALQMALAKTGLPGFKGEAGAGVLSNFQNAITGATDDATVAFVEATLRDQPGLGGGGYYNVRDKMSEGPLSDPKFFAGLFQQTRKMASSPNNAIDIMSHLANMPFHEAKQLYGTTHGFADITGGNLISKMKGLKGAGGLVDAQSKAAMDETGNQVRKVEATISASLARSQTPLVKHLADIGSKAADLVIEGHNISNHTGGLPEYIRSQMQKGVDKVTGRKPWEHPAAGANVPSDARHVSSDGIVGDPVPGNARHNRIIPRSRGGAAPVLPDVRTSHIHITHDASGMLHPQAKQQIKQVIQDHIDEHHRQQTRGNLHTRYARH